MKFITKDLSWVDYLSLVYGSDNEKDKQLLLRNIRKHDIDFYYKNSRFQIHALDWLGHKKYLVMTKFKEYCMNIQLRRRFLSNSWVEVTRFPTYDDHDEGYSSGEHEKGRNSNYTRVPYGCWFYQSKGRSILI